MIRTTATLAAQAAAVAVFFTQPGAALAAALGIAALALLLALDSIRTNRSALLVAAVLTAGTAVAAASVHIGWLSAAAPLAVTAGYILATSRRISLPRLRNRGSARDPR